MMRLQRLRQLPARDWRLAARAWCYVVAARVAVSILSFSRLQHLLKRAWTPAARRCDPRRIGWAVAAASRFVPGASCLPQAVAAHVLLRRAGASSTLILGVDRTPAHGFRAHAWVESAGLAVVGTGPAPEFTELARIE
jgi:hypothetical protein